MKYYLRLFAYLGLVFLLTSCTEFSFGSMHAKPKAASSVDAQVTLSIFSGRTDPTWTLSAAQAKEFNEILAGLPSQAKVEMFEGLGYRGFGVKTAGNLYQVHSGVVRAGDGNYYIDTGKKLEQFLLGTSQKTLEADIYTLVKDQVSN